MSNIIVFRRELRDRPLAAAGEPTGQILLFTGVRYIHDEEEQVAPATAAPDVSAPLGTPREATGERLQA